ncbi:MAG TPA: sialidase family protein, partial [Vicinamibacteria bacterium]|nr:sialidase family protein [Vicinamibacteria bacterium]
DVGIWAARHDGKAWSSPVPVADGRQPDGSRFPCWNPVLFQPSRGPLLLFYKVGPNPREWWGEVRTSTDHGRTWSEAIRLPPGILGPIRAKPVELSGGEILAGSSTEHAGWVVHMERFVPISPSSTASWAEALASPTAWRKVGPLSDPGEFAAIQPTILVHSPTRLQVLCRSRQGFVTEAWSSDGGHTWSGMAATPLANPSAGIDAVRLADGRFLLVYNPTASHRGRLEVAVSPDGRAWRRGVVLEDASGEYSYPAAIQARDGRVHVTYTWRRERIKHVVIDPALLR